MPAANGAVNVAPLVLVRPVAGRISVEDDVLSIFCRYRQLRSKDREAGGVLLGSMSVQGDNVTIHRVTEPGPGDVRSRHRFIRAAHTAQSIVKDAWRASGGVVNYLGEWHSHPEDDPSPSPLDLSNWAMIMSNAQFEQSYLMFFIVGRVATRAWEMSKSGALAGPLAQQLDPT